MWDLLVRFQDEDLPEEFYDDWLVVAGEETKHFNKWRGRLADLGFNYGDFPIHDYLWDAAFITRHSLLERLVLVHCVFEARGLDVYPTTRSKMERVGDITSIEIMDENVQEEVGHVGRAVKWVRFLCERDGLDETEMFHSIVTKLYHGGKLPPPFNLEMRDAAGMPREWYEPLAKPHRNS